MPRLAPVTSATRHESSFDAVAMARSSERDSHSRPDRDARDRVGSAHQARSGAMAVTIVNTKSAPAPIGPYSQAVRAGDTLYVSGVIALDPATGQLVDGGIAAQAERVFASLAAIASAAGGSLANAVKLTIYLTDLADFAAVNEQMTRASALRSPPERRWASTSRRAAMEIGGAVSPEHENHSASSPSRLAQRVPNGKRSVAARHSRARRSVCADGPACSGASSLPVD
jgi:reactive intermediate/imine deaminase